MSGMKSYIRGINDNVPRPMCPQTKFLGSCIPSMMHPFDKWSLTETGKFASVIKWKRVRLGQTKVIRVQFNGQCLICDQRCRTDSDAGMPMLG